MTAKSLAGRWLSRLARLPSIARKWSEHVFNWYSQRSGEEIETWADTGVAPVVTQQPTVDGDAGQPLEIVMSEVVSDESDEKGLFYGLGSFLRRERPREYSATDGVLQKLLSELKNKAVLLGADAVVSTTIKSVRGVDDSGQLRIKMSAIGTAVRLKGSNS